MQYSNSSIIKYIINFIWVFLFCFTVACKIQISVKYIIFIFYLYLFGIWLGKLLVCIMVLNFSKLDTCQKQITFLHAHNKFFLEYDTHWIQYIEKKYRVMFLHCSVNCFHISMQTFLSFYAQQWQSMKIKTKQNSYKWRGVWGARWGLGELYLISFCFFIRAFEDSICFRFSNYQSRTHIA